MIVLFVFSITSLQNWGNVLLVEWLFNFILISNYSFATAGSIIASKIDNFRQFQHFFLTYKISQVLEKIVL